MCRISAMLFVELYSDDLRTSTVIGLFLRFCFRLRQSSFHWIISDGVTSGIGRKWKRSDSSDPDSVELMTPLTTPIFDFHLVISSLMTPTTTPTPTPSLVKTSLKGIAPHYDLLAGFVFGVFIATNYSQKLQQEQAAR